MIQAFATIFGDRNPVHLDPAVAAARGFDSPIAHGAILNGLLSHYVGMVFPGPGSVIHSVSLRYSAPVQAGDTVRLVASVEHYSEAVGTYELKVRFDNLSRERLCASGKVQVGTA